LGKWSGVFYSPVNLDFSLREWVGKKPVNEANYFKNATFFNNDFCIDFQNF
jgi:hypothetical protein